MNSNNSSSLNNNGNMNFNRNGSMNNIHSVEKTMQKFQQLAKDAQSNGDPVLAQNYLQHADHYLRRYNELNERRENIVEKNLTNEKQSSKEVGRKRKTNIIKLDKIYLNSANLKSILILSNSNCFLSSPLSVLPEGNFNF